VRSKIPLDYFHLFRADGKKTNSQTDLVPKLPSSKHSLEIFSKIKRYNIFAAIKKSVNFFLMEKQREYIASQLIDRNSLPEFLINFEAKSTGEWDPISILRRVIDFCGDHLSNEAFP